MDKKLYHSHDKLFRETWSDLANARSFLENYLPETVAAIVNLDTLEICKDSFIEKDLQDYYSDMLYKVKFGDEPGFIYFLFEHKSYPERLIHLQLLEYMVKIWRLQIKQSKSRQLAVVVPLVLYHGKDRWGIEPCFSSQFKGPAQQLAEYLPDFRYLLYDLSGYPDDEIKGTVKARVAMLLLKYIYERTIVDKLPGILALLKELSDQETGLQYFESLIKYLFSNVDDITPEQIQSIVSNTLSEDKGDIIMTLAEKLWNDGLEQGIEKGIQQGLEKGLEQGIEQGLERGLLEGIEFAVSIKFGDSEDCKTIITKIKSIQDINRLKALKGIIKSAKSVPELMKSLDS